MAKLTLEQRVAAIEKHIKTGAPLEALEAAAEAAPAPTPTEEAAPAV